MPLNGFRAAALAVLLAASSSSGLAAELPLDEPFRLTTQDGAPFTQAELKGRPHALFFGFTSCPEVCPTTLYELSSALEQIGPAARDLSVVFVSVDPERDTAEHLKTYLGAFGERFVGLRGTADQTVQAARAFRATFRKVPMSGGDYTMDHTALVYLLDSEGRYFDKLDYRASQTEQIAKLKALLNAK